MAGVDYTKILHLSTRIEENLLYRFAIIGDTVSHFRDVLDDAVKYKNIPTLMDFCIRRGYRCSCILSPYADIEIDGVKIEEVAKFITVFVNAKFENAGIMFTDEDVKLFREAFQDENFRRMYREIIE